MSRLAIFSVHLFHWHLVFCSLSIGTFRVPYTGIGSSFGYAIKVKKKLFSLFLFICVVWQSNLCAAGCFNDNLQWKSKRIKVKCIHKYARLLYFGWNVWMVYEFFQFSNQNDIYFTSFSIVFFFSHRFFLLSIENIGTQFTFNEIIRNIRLRKEKEKLKKVKTKKFITFSKIHYSSFLLKCVK